MYEKNARSLWFNVQHFDFTVKTSLPCLHYRVITGCGLSPCVNEKNKHGGWRLVSCWKWNFSENLENQLWACFALETSWVVCSQVHSSKYGSESTTRTHWRRIKISHLRMVRDACVHTWEIVWKQMCLLPHKKEAIVSFFGKHNKHKLYTDDFVLPNNLSEGLKSVPELSYQTATAILSSCIGLHKQFFFFWNDSFLQTKPAHKWSLQIYFDTMKELQSITNQDA